MSNEPTINTYIDGEGHELTAVPDSQMDLVLRENPLKWSRIVEREQTTSRRSKAKAEETTGSSESE